MNLGLGRGVHPVDPHAEPFRFGAGLDEGELAADEVDAGVTFGGPDAEAAFGPRADPTRRHVGDAAVGVNQPGVHHVFVAAEHGRAHGRNVFHRPADEGVEQIEIVNHQVEDAPDVRTPARVRPVTFGFDEFRYGSAGG